MGLLVARVNWNKLCTIELVCTSVEEVNLEMTLLGVGCHNIVLHVAVNKSKGHHFHSFKFTSPMFRVQPNIHFRNGLFRSCPEELRLEILNLGHLALRSRLNVLMYYLRTLVFIV